MSERTLEQLKTVSEEPLQKLENHSQKIGTPNIQDFKRYTLLNTDLEDVEIDQLLNRLLQEEVLITEDREIVEIRKENLLQPDDQHTGLMEIPFDVSLFRDAKTKKQIAQKYANHLIDSADIIPVWINGATIFYRYNPVTNTWSEVDFQMIRKKAKKDLGTEYDKNMKQELKNQMTDHYRFIEFKDMGLDQDQLLLKNGKVLNMKTRETRKVKRKDYALNCVNANFDDEAESDQLHEFIRQTLDTEDMVLTFQEFLGYTLQWPSDRYEKMLLILGNTDTGKSTLLKVIEQLFSQSNLTKLSFPQIGMDRSFHIKDLKDSVLNIDSDMDDQAIKRKSRIKKVVSKEEIFVEPKGENGFNMKPQANFIVTSNDAPDDAGATDAYYNRFLTLTATSRVSEEDKDRELVDKLTTDENMDWLLQWAIKGYKRLQDNNSFTLNRTEYETKKLWDKFGNSVQKFISEQVRVDREDGHNVPTTDLYECYQEWCDTELENELSQHKFISQAAEHPDLVKRKAETSGGSRRNCFVNIRLADYVV